MEKEYGVCVLGSANIDYFYEVSHIPLPGETIQASQIFVKNGGKGANQAVAAARLGAKTIFAGQVGSDGDKQLLRKQMSQAGVKLEWDQIPGVNTGRAFIFLDKKGQNSIFIIGGANMHYPEAVLSQRMKSAISKSKTLLLQKEIPEVINLAAARLARSLGVIVILDCGGRDQPICQELVSLCNYVSPNQTQLQRLIEIKQPISNQGLAPLFEKYKGLKLLVKQGVHGCTLFQEGQPVISSPSVAKLWPHLLKSRPVIDTVGAGDCFTGAFGVGVSEGLSEQECMALANQAAFLSVTKHGAMPSMPTKAQVAALLEQQQKSRA